jgi:calmodulin
MRRDASSAPVADPTTADKDGRIGAKELGEIIRSQGQNPTEEEVQALIKQVDIVGNNTIDFVEFLQIVTAGINENFNEEELKNAFKALDQDGSGTVSADELKAAMLKLGKRSIHYFVTVRLRTPYDMQTRN